MKYPAMFLLTVSGIISLNSNAYSQPEFYDKYEIPAERQAKPSEDKAALFIGTIPYMPANAFRSGFCCLQIDINNNGAATDVITPYCSDDLFRKSSLSAAKHWKFKPAIVKGEPVKVRNQRHTMKFRLVDDDGKFIPDREGLMSADPRNSTDMDLLCDGLPLS